MPSQLTTKSQLWLREKAEVQMCFEIVQAKLQAVCLSRKVIVTLKRGPEKGNHVERQRRCKVIIGTYMEFNDGCIIAGPDGRRHKGRGTVVRFSYRHGTWSVERPQRCETNRLGYVFTPQGDPCWLKDERESGFTPVAFERSFSAGFVRRCVTGHALAEAGGTVMGQSTQISPVMSAFR